MTVFDIKIVSDAICPWCYLGKRRLERAISTYKTTVPGGSSDTFNISWHPFYLDPTLPKTPVSREEHLIKKIGPERLALATIHLKRLGEAEGINFSFGAKIGNTRDAHRLIQLAKTKSSEVENSVISALFKLHFEEDGDITSQDVLVAAGEKGGLIKAEVKTWLDEGKGGAEVDKEVEEAYKQGISGVPNFTINCKYQFSGAQDVSKFLEIFGRAKRDAAPDISSGGSGGTC
ncbi:thioredoxin-like protein [Podospora fimiseda]|uniref:Thioredoxin-like protein n=1 Tax=Podospora fimiseda TaxID=252190 RepID=A0AAN7GXV5_9PEZI|nr:thioredoxin-like protein [Podospora fimiseda]